MKIISRPKSPELKVGTVKITTQELIDAFKTVGLDQSNSINVVTSRYNFTSFEELEKNKEVLSGQPVLDFNLNKNQISLSFMDGAILRIEDVEDDQSLLVFDRLAETLKSYRTPFYFLGSRVLFIILSLAVLLNTVLIYVFPDVSDIYEKNEIYVLMKRVMAILLLIGIYLSFTLKAQQIVVRRNEGLFQKVHDQGLVTLILFLLGSYLIWTITKFGARP